MGRQTLPRWMGGSLADLALAPTSASLLAPPRLAHAVTMRVRVISSSRRPIGTRVSDAVLLTAPGRTHNTSWPTWPHNVRFIHKPTHTDASDAQYSRKEAWSKRPAWVQFCHSIVHCMLCNIVPHDVLHARTYHVVGARGWWWDFDCFGVCGGFGVSRECLDLACSIDDRRCACEIALRVSRARTIPIWE